MTGDPSWFANNHTSAVSRRESRALSWAERFRGALLGGAVGDALGAGVRTRSAGDIQHWFGRGGVADYLPVFGRRGGATELTQLTVFTLESLLRARAVNGESADWLPTPVVRTNHLRWLYTQGVPWEFAMSGYLQTHPEPSGWLLERAQLFSTRNPAGGALSGLGKLAAQPPTQTAYDTRSGPAVRSGFAGCAVWAAPTMAWSTSEDRVFAAGADVARLLTDDLNVRGATGMHADVLAQLIQGDIGLWDAAGLADARLSSLHDAAGPPAAVRRALHAAMFVTRDGRRPQPAELDAEFDTEQQPGELGTALAAVAATDDFADAVLMAVNVSADSSVTGALAGQLAGALYGPDAIPPRWREESELGEIIETLCADAAEAFAPPPPPPLPKWAQRYVGDAQLGAASGPRELGVAPPSTTTVDSGRTERPQPVAGSNDPTMVIDLRAVELGEQPPLGNAGVAGASRAPEPQRAESPRAAESQRAPEAPRVRESQRAAEAPRVPEAPIGPERSRVPEPPAAQERSPAPERSSVPDGPRAAESPAVRARSYAPETSGDQDEVHASESSEGRGVERLPEPPHTSDPASAAPYSLESLYASASPASPASPGTPVHSIAPESQTAPEAAATPEPPRIPETPVAQEPPHLPESPAARDRSHLRESPVAQDFQERAPEAARTPEPATSRGSPADPQGTERLRTSEQPKSPEQNAFAQRTDRTDMSELGLDPASATAADADRPGPASPPELGGMFGLSAERTDREELSRLAKLVSLRPEEAGRLPAEQPAEPDSETAEPEIAQDDPTTSEQPDHIGQPEWSWDAPAESSAHAGRLRVAPVQGGDRAERSRTPVEDSDRAEPSREALAQGGDRAEPSRTPVESGDHAEPSREAPARSSDHAEQPRATPAENSDHAEAPQHDHEPAAETGTDPRPPAETRAAKSSGGHAKPATTDEVTPSLTERVLGCFLGGALGDALGADLEFASAEQISERFGPDGPQGLREAYGVQGAITDDTQLTLFTAEGLIRSSVARRTLGISDPMPEVQLAYQRWLHTQGVEWESAAGQFRAQYSEPDGWLVEVGGLFSTRAPGKTIFQALARFGDGHPSGTLTEPINDSKGCGGVMRSAPVAMYSADPPVAFELAARVAALTHSHPSGYLSAGALAVIVQQALLGQTLDDGVWLALQVLETWEGHEETSALLKAGVELAEQGVPTPQQIARTLGGGWVGEQALAIAVCAALAGGDDVPAALRIAAHHDGDSDSTGAICGNIVGALTGVSALPVGWLADLELRDVVEQIALDCVAEFGESLLHDPDSADPVAERPADEEWDERYPVRSLLVAGHGDPPTALLPAVQDEPAEAPTQRTEVSAESEQSEQPAAGAPEPLAAFPAPKPSPRRIQAPQPAYDSES